MCFYSKSCLFNLHTRVVSVQALQSGTHWSGSPVTGSVDRSAGRHTCCCCEHKPLSSFSALRKSLRACDSVIRAEFTLSVWASVWRWSKATLDLSVIQWPFHQLWVVFTDWQASGTATPTGACRGDSKGTMKDCGSALVPGNTGGSEPAFCTAFYNHTHTRTQSSNVCSKCSVIVTWKTAWRPMQWLAAQPVWTAL